MSEPNKLKRFPLLPTILVAAAVAVMIGLGIWQLQRAEWKAGLIAERSRAGALRPASLDCAIDAAPEVRAGRNRAGEVGYRYLLPCGEVTIDAGWSQRPDAIQRLIANRRFAGLLAAGEEGGRAVLVLDPPLPPLLASAPPAAADLPNNHRLYAVQWFFFAAAASVIYVLALRRRRALPLPAGERDTKP